MTLELTEKWIRNLAIAYGLLTLAYAIWRAIWIGLRKPPGRSTGAASKILRAPILLITAVIWTGIIFFLWRPLPVDFSGNAHIAVIAFGTLLYCAGLTLYLWGAVTLGDMYKASSSFGVELNAGHRLITHGPFAIVRHPLYLGIQLAGIGGLLLFQNWAFAFIFLNFVFLFIRAKKEEQALAQEFGDEWTAYSRKVPFWIPGMPR